ncbi:alanine dehydrogenase [Cryomorpha ignava]|uniref:alanine dehydrogenase n=1 Tax=Cryomorpha ignava TaxID=101383 RepID=A0A7K3WRI0_9FLAO|nr:alanine dehydrogenase [Cryomorpha ignava]NEN24084.1 alanine dehydrogenase [Cryomorpha ignava]
MVSSKEALKALARQASLQPQEQLMAVGEHSKHLQIGIPRETSYQEKRVGLTPDAVAVLVSNGHEVVVESEAGKSSYFEDKQYSEAGAKIAYDRKEAFQCDLVLKVAPPSHEEISMMGHKQTLFSALQLSVQPRDTLRKLMEKKVSAIAWDYIQDEEQIFPVVRAMGEIAGNTAVVVAAEHLSIAGKGQGLMFGGISGVAPTEVVIIGAGTVAEYACRAALGFGASVKVFDFSIYRLRRIQNDLGQRLFTSVIQPEDLKKALRQADVVIGALRGSDGRTPTVVTEEMVSGMKAGSVIVDISIDKGGCFETSEVTNHQNPTFVKHGVTHYCVPNIASRVSRTASIALSNIFLPLILNIGQNGGCSNLIKRDMGFRHGVYIYNGTLTNETLGEVFRLPYKDIDLLFAAF